VYERSAILEHFKSTPIGLRSPVTKEFMGRRLFPAVQIKNLIETLIENHAIQGDLAEAWTKKQDERKKFETLTKKANDGDTNAMFTVGMLYHTGLQGVSKDNKLAYNWLKKAADRGHIKGLAWVGYVLVHGIGVRKNSTLGVVFSAMAAEGGSDAACCSMGTWFADGRHGLSVDTSQAKRFLQKGTSGACSYLHALKGTQDRARSKLQELCSNEALP
jgi:TPR repeat protein